MLGRLLDTRLHTLEGRKFSSTTAVLSTLPHTGPGHIDGRESPSSFFYGEKVDLTIHDFELLTVIGQGKCSLFLSPIDLPCEEARSHAHTHTHTHTYQTWAIELANGRAFH